MITKTKQAKRTTKKKAVAKTKKADVIKAPVTIIGKSTGTFVPKPIYGTKPKKKEVQKPGIVRANRYIEYITKNGGIQLGKTVDAVVNNTDKIKIWVGKDRAGQDMFVSIEPTQVAHGLEFK